MGNVKGFKVFNPDWTCRGFQFEVGQTYEEKIVPSACDRGFHFCKEAKDCFNYYGFNPNNKVAEVIALGDIAEHGDKCCTNKIEIVREITWEELLTIVNIGKGNSGLLNSGDCNSGNWNSGNRNSGDCNSGNWNSGNRNSGDWNSGDWNSGNRNSGDWNSGNRNSGNRNSGDCNSGNRNSGDWNSGNRNSGDCNSGNRNSGNWNSGDWNSGNWNSGNCNSGDCNSGNRNSGNRNSGDCNSGDWNSGNRNSGDCNSGNRNSGNRNSGNRNSGDWNSGDCNSGNRNSGDWNKASNVAGCFNTEPHKLIFFDKLTDTTFDQWRMSDAYYLMNQIDFKPTEWVWESDMTDEEKAEHPEWETIGGYLKKCDNTDACVTWWNGLSEIRRNVIRSIPNFDADKFFKITGIRV